MPDLDGQIESLFGGLGDNENYPGSKRKRRDPPPPKVNTSLYGELPWDHKPKLLVLNGIGERELFTIGNLAQALNRRPVTIRSWEVKGVLPHARIRDKEKRRLYTRRQVEGLVKLAELHGILDFDVRPDTIPAEFTQGALSLWKEPL